MSSDVFASVDAEFERAHFTILQDITSPIDPNAAEQAARTLATLAIDSGDRIKLCWMLAIIDDYTRASRPVPAAFLTSLCETFDRFRAGASMDEAFNLARPRRGRPESWGVREWARTNAGLVAFWISKGDTLEVAVERVAEFRKQSESQIKRDYLRYRRRIKSE